MNRRLFLRNFAVAGATGALACSRRETQSGLRLLQVAITPRTAMSGLFVAMERGYFQQAGFEVEAHPINRSPQIIPLVASGAMDAALPTINTAFVNAVAKGARLAIVAARQTQGAVCGKPSTLYGNREVFPDGFDVARLRGKRVSIAGEQTFTEFSLDVLLSSAGMTSDDVVIVPLRQEDAFAALYAGRIDALMASDITADPAAVSDSYVQGPALADFIPDLQRGFIVFGPSLLDGNIEDGARFISAYLRGAKDYMDGYTPEQFDELARADGLDPAEARGQCRDLMVEGGTIDPQSIQMFVDWTVRRGYCETAPTLDRLIDERFLERAHELGNAA